MAILEAKNISKSFNKGTHTEVDAVTDVSLSVEAGDVVLIMGPSGSGKTTFLTMLGGLLRPSSGEVLLDGQSIGLLSANNLTKLRRQHLGFIFQSFNLLENLCAWENVYVGGLGMSNRKQKAIELLKRLGLEGRMHQKPREMSGGERQRVAIARALINNPPIILADEPTANLDSKNGLEVTKLLCEIACQEQKAVVIVSHDQRLVQVAKRVITIEDGRLVNEVTGEHNKYCAHHTSQDKH
ncbi:MAG: ABC transporter ATP-binding protein [Patescibacteria group bacterium]